MHHGHATRIAGLSATYRAWSNMLQRCLNEKNGRYADYGGRGITVYIEWQKFENFLADMGVKPEGLTLDRIDNDKGYTPSNCRWVTYQQNNLNKRKYKNNISGVKGISWKGDDGKWVVHIRTPSGRKYLGSFYRLEAAIEARRAHGPI